MHTIMASTISGQTEINVITSQDYFIVTDDTTAATAVYCIRLSSCALFSIS